MEFVTAGRLGWPDAGVQNDAEVKNDAGAAAKPA
jgi:hypothetical protein